MRVVLHVLERVVYKLQGKIEVAAKSLLDRDLWPGRVRNKPPKNDRDKRSLLDARHEENICRSRNFSCSTIHLAVEWRGATAKKWMSNVAY